MVGPPRRSVAAGSTVASPMRLGARDNALMPDQSAIRAALDIGATAGTEERTIDITTTGAKSGDPHRIEIWFHQIQGRWYIVGSPPRIRGWYRNLESNPRFTFHLKNEVKADLSATARPITEPEERQAVFQQILDGLDDPSITLPVEFPPLEDWLKSSPAVEVTFDDFASGDA
jgi:deazaflavin-dependent oxidoreductase (nitroreductase family)